MLVIQYVLIIVIVFILWQTLKKFKERSIGLREFIFWTIFWIIVATVVLLPQVTIFLANHLGVGRGVDLVIYASLIFIFYMIFRLFVRQQKIEKNISKIVEEIARKK